MAEMMTYSIGFSEYLSSDQTLMFGRVNRAALPGISGGNTGKIVSFEADTGAATLADFMS
jgi:hypothetical protein